jgi:tetratricopeptide (TPR) repeat protein
VKKMINHSPLNILVAGHVRGVTTRRLASLIQAAGHCPTRSYKAADIIAVAHSWARTALSDDGALLPPLDDVVPKLVSEGALRLMIGLPGAPRLHGTFTSEEVQRASGLSSVAYKALSLFDLFEGDNGRHTFADLKISKKVSNWIRDEGFSIPELIVALRGRLNGGGSINTIHLARMNGGALGAEAGGYVSDLDGQMLLPISLEGPDLDFICQQALDAEQSGDFAQAASFYDTASRLDPNDAVIQFNRGNVLCDLGEDAAARICYQRAIALDPAFSEAWFNLGLLSEQGGRLDEAKADYRRAIVSDPANDVAKFSLARLLAQDNAYSESLPLWDELAETGSADTRIEARKWALICRLEIRANARCPGFGA